MDRTRRRCPPFLPGRSKIDNSLYYMLLPAVFKVGALLLNLCNLGFIIPHGNSAVLGLEPQERNMTELTMNIDKIINASIEKVFDAWLNSKLMSRFMRSMPEMSTSEVEIDARVGGNVGGNCTVIMHLGDRNIPHTGTYLQIKYHRQDNHSIRCKVRFFTGKKPLPDKLANHIL